MHKTHRPLLFLQRWIDSTAKKVVSRRSEQTLVDPMSDQRRTPRAAANPARVGGRMARLSGLAATGALATPRQRQSTTPTRLSSSRRAALSHLAPLSHSPKKHGSAPAEASSRMYRSGFRWRADGTARGIRPKRFIDSRPISFETGCAERRDDRDDASPQDLQGLDHVQRGIAADG